VAVAHGEVARVKRFNRRVQRARHQRLSTRERRRRRRRGYFMAVCPTNYVCCVGVVFISRIVCILLSGCEENGAACATTLRPYLCTIKKNCAEHKHALRVFGGICKCGDMEKYIQRWAGNG
jgi:hypothetical protein